ncbi:MAG TPA: hypothetical protein VE863_10375 [Pyrinomonadaceae bacterium]|jgi:hypothetical protein|nr:hypothetical protein [Pyrinomonadaceae bacterium]
MRKSALYFTLVVLFTFGGVRAHAQSDDKKFEVGGQFSVLRAPTQIVTASGSSFTRNENAETVYGFGGRFGYEVSKNVTLEAESNFFPRDNVLDDGRKTQAFFGVKAGKRMEKFGVFAKARPGFVRYSRGDYQAVGGCIALFPPPVGCFQPVTRTNFAIDLGGVFEFYPTKRTILRFDAGDTLVRLPARNMAAFQTNATTIFTLVVVPAPAETRHQFQGIVGFGFRF